MVGTIVRFEVGPCRIKIELVNLAGTILPAKSDSDIIFAFKVIRDLSIYHLCINPIRGRGFNQYNTCVLILSTG